MKPNASVIAAIDTNLLISSPFRGSTAAQCVEIRVCRTLALPGSESTQAPGFLIDPPPDDPTKSALRDRWVRMNLPFIGCASP
jgi:hypothetical protein